MIREARVRKNMSQGQLAKITGVKNTHIFRIEHGRSGVSVESWAALAHGLDLDEGTFRLLAAGGGPDAEPEAA